MNLSSQLFKKVRAEEQLERIRPVGDTSRQAMFFAPVAIETRSKSLGC